MNEWEDIRKVKMSKKLMDVFATRDPKGYRMIWDWGEPDAEGFYAPTATLDMKDKLVDDRQSDLLIFLAARLVNVYGESPNTDYILLAEKLSGQKVATDCFACGHQHHGLCMVDVMVETKDRSIPSFYLQCHCDGTSGPVVDGVGPMADAYDIVGRG